MSGSDLKVRCLASTRVSDQAWQEQNSEDGDGLHDPGNSKNPEEYVLSERYGPVSEPVNESTITSNQDEFEEDWIPTPESTSQSTSGSDDDSDSCSEETGAMTSTSHDTGYTSCIQEAQLSPDGTCIFTSDYSRSFSVYPIDTRPVPVLSNPTLSLPLLILSGRSPPTHSLM
jgi:hypothetical protein